MNYGSFKNVINKIYSYISYEHNYDLVQKDLQGLICHKTQPTNAKALLIKEQ